MLAFNLRLYRLALRGIGIGNFESPALSGEHHFISNFCAQYGGAVVLDVGANVGDYSAQICRLDQTSKVFAFEPHPASYESLESQARVSGFTAINMALGNARGTQQLFDYLEGNGSQHATLYRDVIEEMYGAPSTSVEVAVETVDSFMALRGIDRINLLKIDTEGNELQVLQGSFNAIKNKQIDIVHFEFNSMNVMSKAFMRDFYDLLPGFSFYRMFPDGLAFLAQYNCHLLEIFEYQNIVAIRNGCSFKP